VDAVIGEVIVEVDRVWDARLDVLQDQAIGNTVALAVMVVGRL